MTKRDPQEEFYKIVPNLNSEFTPRVVVKIRVRLKFRIVANACRLLIVLRFTVKIQEPSHFRFC